MFHLVITLAAAFANLYAAYLDFSQDERVVAVMRTKRVPASWAVPLGAVKAAGALGLLAGFAVPALGTAAAAGLVLFFLCALAAHLRVRSYRLMNWAVFFVLAVAALAAGLTR